MFDMNQELCFIRDVTMLCSSCYYKLRRLRVLKPVSTLILSSIDCCSALYEGLLADRVSCLGQVPRTAVPLIGLAPLPS